MSIKTLSLSSAISNFVFLYIIYRYITFGNNDIAKFLTNKLRNTTKGESILSGDFGPNVSLVDNLTTFLLTLMYISIWSSNTPVCLQLEAFY